MSPSTSSTAPGGSSTASPLALIEALIRQLPQCVQAAALQGVANNGCNGDIACNCQDDTFLSLVENVIEHTCSAADGQQTLTSSKFLCTNAVPSLTDSRVALITGLYPVFLTLAATSVGLRLLSRRVSGTKLWWDDYFIVIALAFTLGLTIDGLVGVQLGWGQHILMLGYYEIMDFGKMWWTGQLLFVNAITAVKISILFFYLRIFPARTFRQAATIIGYIQVAWWISFLFATMFACTPIAYFWNKTLPGGFCTNILVLLYIATGTNFVADILVLILPIPVLWGLQMELTRKLGIIGIFLLGSFACLSPIVRFPLLWRINEVDTTWTTVDAGIWIVVESNLGVLCACIPVMGPALQAILSVSSFSLLRSRLSRYSRSRSIGDDMGESKPLPPLPSSSSDEEAGPYEISRGTGSETTERILQLGHLWELDDRRGLWVGEKRYR